MKSIFNTGSTVRIRATFEDPDTGQPVDPGTVTINVRAPDGTVTTESFGGGGAIVKESTGKYLYRLTLEQEGTYRWKWVGEAVDETAVLVGQLDSVSEVDF